MSRILIVEDSPDIQALIQMLLEAAGYETVAVMDGRAAVAAAKERQPDLILMDLSLPILSGWEATRRIRADPATATIPIVAVTAHAMQGDRERALAAGCNGFIPKPINEATFASHVAGFLADRSPQRTATLVRTDLPASQPGRILVVDDQAEIAELLKTDLEAEGHEVVVATSATRALQLFENYDHFELCVIDVMLGGSSGYDLSRRLAETSPDYVPVLLVTAGTIDREKGYSAGADDFIGKPLDTVELRARARSLIRVGRLVREQRRVGSERAEAYRKLSELDRMRSDFLSTVSHELRTPLNTIVLLAHQLLNTENGAADPARRASDTRVLLDAAETLRRMIDNMLDLAKLEAGQRDLHPQSVSIADLLTENANLIGPQARAKNLELVVHVDPALPPTTFLDRDKLSRVLVNLLSNAVKYTAAGRVTLSARPWQSSTTFEVSDTGYGIPADMVASAFEPFRQIRTRSGDAPQGTGLGLTISKQLVELMGGDLILESKEGDGTSVRFTLPSLPATADGARETADVPFLRPSSEASALILIVEDDASSRYGLAALLQSERYRIAQASDLKEADRFLESADPDAIVLDITLPDGDGAVWLRSRIDREPTFPPVIALTGVTADEDTRRIESSGVARILTKPVNVSRLLAAVREISGVSKP